MVNDQCPIRQAVQLAGGRGTRLRPLTYQRPKALLPVLNRPLISYELELLGRYGVAEVILAAGYQAERLRPALGDGSRWGVELRCVQETLPLDTAGAMKNVETLIGGPFFVFNGDLILDVEPNLMAQKHLESGATATILLRQVTDIAHFGLVQRDRDGFVTAFVEKAAHDATGQNTVNAGVYIMLPEVMAEIPAGQAYANETDLFPRLLERGAKLCGYLPDQAGYWNDVGRLETYLQVNRDLLDGRLPWLKLPAAELAQIGAEVQIHEPCCWAKDVAFERGARVGPYVSLDEGVRVGEEAKLEDCVVHARATIGAGANLRSLVVAENEQVPAGHKQAQGVCCSYER